MNDFPIKNYKINYTGNAQSASIPNNNYSNNTLIPEKDTGLLDSLTSYARSVKNRLFASKKSHPDIRVMYANLFGNMDKEGKVFLNRLYKNGELLSRNSNDGSSTLENLYKIMTKPRLPYFDKKDIVKETLKTLADPYVITQNFGEISPADLVNIVNAENKKLLVKIKKNKANPDNIGDIYPIKPEDVFNLHGSTCPAASIEFNLADRRPSEFTRYVEGLTSPEKSVKTRIKFSDLSENMMEAINALIDEHSDFKPLNWQNLKITIKPDKNAYLRADTQEHARLKDTRSLIDVLMQSSFMQLGSKATYNSLTDRRSKDVGDGAGLNQSEIAFVESIVESDSKKVPILYMKLNDDLTKVMKYNYDFEKTKNQFMDSLDQGKNIITGFMVDMDKNGNIITPQGHEVSVTGYKYDKKGKLWFKYNDTDDGNHFAPSWIEADKFIPTIHHANIPVSVLKEKSSQSPPNYFYLQEYNFLKNKHKN